VNATIDAFVASTNRLGSSFSTVTGSELVLAKADNRAIFAALATIVIVIAWLVLILRGILVTLSLPAAISSESIAFDCATLFRRGARVGEVDVDTRSGMAAIADISFKDLRAFVEGICVLGSTGNGDGSTLHIHFAVTSLVEPDPSERHLAVRDVLWDLDRELVGDWPGSGCRDAEELISVHRLAVGYVHWAATNNAVNNPPLGVLVGMGIGAQGKLARAT